MSNPYNALKEKKKKKKIVNGVCRAWITIFIVFTSFSYQLLRSVHGNNDCENCIMVFTFVSLATFFTAI